MIDHGICDSNRCVFEFQTSLFLLQLLQTAHKSHHQPFSNDNKYFFNMLGLMYFITVKYFIKYSVLNVSCSSVCPVSPLYNSEKETTEKDQVYEWMNGLDGFKDTNS
jgi:hypothetical protein